MKLKINTLKFLLFLFIISMQKSVAQEITVKLEGVVKYNSTLLQDINILNKATLFGTSSSIKGSFTIYAKEGDSILFSSLVYEDRVIKITRNHLNSKKITVHLEPDYEQLDEVMIEKEIFINWKSAAVPKGTILSIDEMSAKKAPNARNLTDPNAQAGGLNPITLFMMLTKKARLKRKERKLELEKNKRLKAEFATTIKNEYEATFFSDVLHISEKNIYLFLDYCEGNGLPDFYKSEEIVVKNFLIKQSKDFKLIQK